MLTLDEHGGEASGVEMRPLCVSGLPNSAGMLSAGCPDTRRERRDPSFPSPRGRKTVAFEATMAVFRLGDGMARQSPIDRAIPKLTMTVPHSANHDGR
jgi:hypothetical protein